MNHSIKKDKNIKFESKFFFHINFSLSMFCLLIFSEIILFNFCGLNEHTIVNEIIKSKDEELNMYELSLSNEKNSKSNIQYF